MVQHGEVTDAGFSIGFDDTIERDELASGRLAFGEFAEFFESSLLTWSRSDYRRSWREAVAALIEGQDRAALVTLMHDPSTANFIRWWPMYRVAGTVLFQEQLLFLSDLATPFDLDDPFRSVHDRRTDGEVSEWSLPHQDLASWLSAE